MKEFLLANWYYLALFVLAVAGFIVSLVAKKKGGKTNLLDSAKAALLEQIPYWIIISEGLVSGEDKMNNVIQLGIAYLNKFLGRNLSSDENDYFVALIKESAEKILSAPQKKLIVAEKSKKSPYVVK